MVKKAKSNAVTDLLPDPVDLCCGQFSRKDAALIVTGGVKHLHSSVLGPKDPFARATADALAKKTVPCFGWENTPSRLEKRLSTSKGRQEWARSFISTCFPNCRRDTRERLESILEELLSNALFHGFTNPDGTARYQRLKQADLKPNELLVVRAGDSMGGLLLEVEDSGGTLTFAMVAGAFKRCYGAASHQIESKESGAGLGLYMVFESATHMKVVVVPGKTTIVSCWLSDKPVDGSDYFSFNFFERR